MSGELNAAVVPSRWERIVATLGRRRERRRHRVTERMQRHPFWGAVLYISIRFAAWFAVLGLALSLVLHEGAKPAMVFYVAALATGFVGGLGLAGERFRASRADVRARVDVPAPESRITRHLRALTGIAMIALAVVLLGLGLYAERFGGTAKDEWHDTLSAVHSRPV
jgi:hypothetical protein